MNLGYRCHDCHTWYLERFILSDVRILLKVFAMIVMLWSVTHKFDGEKNKNNKWHFKVKLYCDHFKQHHVNNGSFNKFRFIIFIDVCTHNIMQYADTRTSILYYVTCIFCTLRFTWWFKYVNRQIHWIVNLIF